MVRHDLKLNKKEESVKKRKEEGTWVRDHDLKLNVVKRRRVLHDLKLCQQLD